MKSKINKNLLNYLKLIIEINNKSIANNWKILSGDKTNHNFIILKDRKASELLGLSLKSIKNYKSTLKSYNLITVIPKFTVNTNRYTYKNISTLIVVDSAQIAEFLKIHELNIHLDCSKNQDKFLNINKPLTKLTPNQNIKKVGNNRKKDPKRPNKNVINYIKNLLLSNNIKVKYKSLLTLTSLFIKNKSIFRQALDKTILRRDIASYIGSTVSKLLNPIGYIIKMYNIIHNNYRQSLKIFETLQNRKIDLYSTNNNLVYEGFI